ncbi:DNA primase large subunit isoform X2 [Hydra vulgaris]|uniref:DNA primase large subunit n=1 Tax=Hydra vulgaris TaxID=6087 RepID=A0ABM4D8X7_HYDVU
MNFSSRNRRSIRITAKTENFEKYNRLLFYTTPPNEEIALEEFERFAIDRLKILREVENVNIRFKRGTTDYEEKMRKILKDFMPHYFDTFIGDSSLIVRQDKLEEERKQLEYSIAECRKDSISHFILRLAFSRSEDLRRWFLTQEMDLFRFRFQLESNENINSFLKQNKLLFDPIDKETKMKIKEKLRDSMFNVELHNVMDTEFYKVPFTDVLDLVRSRKVFICKGFAYVPQQELVSIIIGIYRTQLSLALAITARKLPYLEEDTRLLPILKNLSNTYVGESFDAKKTSDGEKLELATIDESSKISFPLCMRNLHEGLRKEHHLKHNGRLQLGLFVKAAGLTLDEALQYWRTEFTKNMDVEKFDKQYAYNIRHSYGKEGKRANYTPYSCLKIITSNPPGAGDYHGCPFKYSDADILQRRLQTYKIPNDAVNEIIDLVKHQHYQIACAKYFEVTHKSGEGTATINHPNQYFVESKRFLNGGIKTSTQVKPKIESKDSVVNSKSLNVSNLENKSKDDEYGLDDDMDIL